MASGNLRCPICGGDVPLELWSGNERRIVELCLAMPREVGPFVTEYLAFFRDPKSTRGLQKARQVKLLEEIQKMTTESWIQWDKEIARAISPKVWADAFAAFFKSRPRPPLENQNYLRKIAYRLADDSARAMESRTLQHERSGQRDPRPGGGVGNLTQILADIQKDVGDQVSLEDMQRIREERLGKRRKKEDETEAPKPTGRVVTEEEKEAAVKRTVESLRESGADLERIARSIPKHYRPTFERLYGGE